MAAQVASLYSSIRTIELGCKSPMKTPRCRSGAWRSPSDCSSSGNDSELDVQQAKAQYLGTLATIPQLEGSLRQTQNALSVLLARPPGRCRK